MRSKSQIQGNASFRAVIDLPPTAVRTIRDLIFWQYAKIISESAGYGKKQYSFVMDRYKKLCSGEISWSTSIREYVKEREKTGTCIYCGKEADLTLEHILPRSRGGPDSPDNAVWICRNCNSSKGARRPYEWYGLDNRYGLSRIAEGKYLKLLYSLHERMGTLNVDDIRLLCPRCDLGSKCPEKEKLTVYCLEGLFKKTVQ
jgi:hypothetical protein